MIDFAKITVKAGDGGRGIGSFKHVKGKRLGKADGGDGGDGGNVYIEATTDLNTLEPYRYVKDYAAKNGQNGYSNLRRGARAEDLVLKVPLGTQIEIFAGPVRDDQFAVDSLSQEKNTKSVNREPTTDNGLTYDLTDSGQRILVARAGVGGRGNAKLRDEFGRRPKAGEKGIEGEAVDIVLELKLIADVGIIGMPNAGKSTFLNSVTRAKAQVADYPFTTLEPNLGVLELTVNSSQLTDSDNREPTTVNRQLILADIPGLIEGASEGKGLGDLFLRHIERTKLLLHLIDVTKVPDGHPRGELGRRLVHPGGVASLWDDYQKIRSELREYSKDLAKKKEIIVLTKIDLIGKETLAEIEAIFKKKRKKVFAISAVSGEGIDSLINEVVKKLSHAQVRDLSWDLS